MSVNVVEGLDDVQSMISRQNLNDFIDMYDNLRTVEKDRVNRLLKKSLKNAIQGYGEISQSYNNLRSFIRFQEDLLDLIETPVENRPDLDDDNDNRVDTTDDMDDSDETFQNLDDSEEDGTEDPINIAGDSEDPYDDDQDSLQDDEPADTDDTDNDDLDNDDNPIDADDRFEGNEEDLNEEESVQKRERGRASKISELVEHFDLTNKATTLEEEVDRIKNLVDYNEWFNIGDERTPHNVIMNATYLASIQFLEANSKNANYSVLTRVMLNPTGAYFEGESVVIRNRYLEDKQEAMEYMERQMEKIQKQFFYEKSPSVIANHGNKNSYYGFHLPRENRKNYKDVLQELEV